MKRKRSAITKWIWLFSMLCVLLNKILRRSRPEAKQIDDRKAKAVDTFAADQQNIALLTSKLATAPAAQKDNLQDQIDVAKAQADLDQDELDDASEDLEQAGGDPQSKIKRLQAEHEAGDHNTTSAGSAVECARAGVPDPHSAHRHAGLARAPRKEGTP